MAAIVKKCPQCGEVVSPLRFRCWHCGSKTWEESNHAKKLSGGYEEEAK
jgi:uncharacterized OB-fold protein